MNRLLAQLLGRAFMMPEGDGAAVAGGGGGDGGAAGGNAPAAGAVDAAGARTVLSEYVSDPESLKTMPDADVLKLHGKVTGAQKKAFETQQATDRQARIDAAKELKLEAPKDSKLQQADVDRISAYAREKGLSKAEAEEILTREGQAMTLFEQRQMEQVKTQRADWVKTVTNDPEIGGANLAATQKNAQRVIDTFMTPEMRVKLRESGFGDYPDFVRFLNKVGASMAEDKPNVGDGGAGGGGGKKSAEDVLYGGTTQS